MGWHRRGGIRPQCHPRTAGSAITCDNPITHKAQPRLCVNRHLIAASPGYRFEALFNSGHWLACAQRLPRLTLPPEHNDKLATRKPVPQDPSLLEENGRRRCQGRCQSTVHGQQPRTRNETEQHRAGMAYHTAGTQTFSTLSTSLSSGVQSPYGDGLSATSLLRIG